MHALLALCAASFLDQLRRASTLVLVACEMLAILSLRYFSAFGLGYEVVQLKEMGVYTVGLLGAVAVLLFNLPRDDEPTEGAETQLLTRPVGPGLVSCGSWLGRLGCMALLMLTWTAAIYAALWWLSLSEPRIFSYRGATSALQEGHAVLVPVFGQFVTGAILLAFAQLLARTRRPVAVAAGLLGLYALGFASAALGEPWARILPDLTRQDLTAGLWGGHDNAWDPLLVVHGLAWCAVGLALDSGLLRARVAT